MREGFRCGVILKIIYGICIFLVCYLLARPLPYSYLAGWIGMMAVEAPLLVRIYRRGES